MRELIKTLCSLNGTSGREDAVRDYIKTAVGDAETRTDALGSLIVNVKGRRRAKNRVMLCAHMDEVGVMVTCVHPDGLLSFCTVGGIQATALAGQQVRFADGTIGVIGLKPVHLLSPDEKLTAPETERLYIDIGETTKAAAEQRVAPGDAAVFVGEFTALGENRVLSKAIDDRVGCAVLLDMIKSGVEYDAVFCFSVQEEVGSRGAKAAAFGIAPDFAIVLEGTTAADVADAAPQDRVCLLGGGACVSLMDKATVYAPKLTERVFAVAERYGIPAQPKTAVAGGNDAGAIHMSGAGVRTVTLNVPCRYIHSASSVCDLRDVAAVRALTERICEDFANADPADL